MALACTGTSAPNQNEHAAPDESAVVGGTRAFGDFPLCEASALVVSPDAQRFWVADNEVHNRLFRFDTPMLFDVVQDVSMTQGGRPRDIEALARLDDRLLIVGSHSGRGRGSEAKRHRLRWMTLTADGDLRPGSEISTDPESWQADEDQCVRTLFSGLEQGQPLCRAFVEAGGIDIEGAAALEGRIWLGLRAPLVDGKAVLIRMTNLREFRFDEVKLLDLGGAGIRALSASEDTLFGIAGPQPSTRTPHHRLFRVGEHMVEWRQTLPAGAEGLAIVGDDAWVVFDGARGRRRCRHPARWLHIDLSRHD